MPALAVPSDGRILDRDLLICVHAASDFDDDRTALHGDLRCWLKKLDLRREPAPGSRCARVERRRGVGKRLGLAVDQHVVDVDRVDGLLARLRRRCERQVPHDGIAAIAVVIVAEDLNRSGVCRSR